MLEKQKKIIEQMKTIAGEINEFVEKIDEKGKKPSIYPKNRNQITTITALIIFALTILAIVFGLILKGCAPPDPFCDCKNDDSADCFENTDSGIDSGETEDPDTADTDTDTADTADTADTDTGTSTDTWTDSDTEIEIQDTDTNTSHLCPWTCRPVSSEPEFTCDEYDFPAEEPQEVWNLQYVCPIGSKCCQPWPPNDDLGISDYCADFENRSCSVDCPENKIDNEKICFNANAMCCNGG